ncbi:MAG TPA: RluA family pseudouridine synthase [Desulfuromonas sp.]|nr:RluA family pseudouridine synthase [Desulfuromonas sp.]
MRLDQFVAAQCPDISRTLARRLIDLGGLHAGGRRVSQCSRGAVCGETVELFIDGLSLDLYVLTPADILYRDDYLLALDKPAGIETQPTPARYKGTLYAALLEYLRDPRHSARKTELGMVQRLDRDTSGVILFSIHPRAHAGLTKIFSERSARKIYLALVSGVPAEAQGEIRSHLARGRDNRVRSVPRGGKEALTRYRVVETFADAALLEIELLTGRSHQIRAHLSEAGHPLLGDIRYGGWAELRGETVPRQMLHSASLALQHPVGGKPLVLEAPLPADFLACLQRLQPPQPASGTKDTAC